ncbi:MAG: sulfatase [Bacteroidota bacterium]
MLSLRYILLASIFFLTNCTPQPEIASPPNILFCIADDWGWPHAGVYGDTVVQTPTFDRLARSGVLFEHAYVSSPSCSPSRGAILTGQDFWRLGEGANLWSTLDRDQPVYPLLLEEAGYAVGSWRKSWGPGDLKAGGYDSLRPAGPKYPQGLRQFLAEKEKDQPFCFWFGASDPHRAYEKGSGAAAGIDPAKVQLPGFYPESEEIRSDIADYYYEVQRFDREVGEAIQLLDSLGELQNTLIVVTGDHGMPFPRCKGNLYDMGVRVPLVMHWGTKVKPWQRIPAFVSLTDLAPTFLEMAGVEVPEQMTGKSLAKLLRSQEDEQSLVPRNHIVFGRERHTPAQASPSIAGYPSRGIRTQDYLYIRNFFPDRWPAGVPDGATHPMNSFADCDNGPTKTYLVENADLPTVQPFYALSFAKRPAEELYDLAQDPYQLHNLAQQPNLQTVKEQLALYLNDALVGSGDPRVVPGQVDFDTLPYRASYELNGIK